MRGTGEDAGGGRRNVDLDNSNKDEDRKAGGGTSEGESHTLPAHVLAWSVMAKG